MRVVLAEDIFLLRDGLIRLLQDFGMEVVAAVESGPELWTALVEHRPDAAVVDVRLPPSFSDEGLRVALRARREYPEFPVLILSQYVEQVYARELLVDGRGGIGYLLKERVTNARDFVDSVRSVAQGGTVMDPEVVGALLRRGRPDGPVGSLTPREREVLALMAEGRSNSAISSRLFITERSVAKHTANIFDKLGLAVHENDNRRVRAVLAYLDR